MSRKLSPVDEFRAAKAVMVKAIERMRKAILNTINNEEVIQGEAQDLRPLYTTLAEVDFDLRSIDLTADGDEE